MTLQEQGEGIAAKFGFLDVLGRYGEAHLVGNLALHTTVKPDVDYLVYCERTEWPEIITSLKHDFTAIGLADYEERELKQSGKYLITFEYSQDGITWSIDTTLTERGGDYLTDSYQFYLDFHDRFTPEVIERIIPLKRYFYEKHMLRNSMSYYIYRAVIDDGARKVADIYDYLKKQKIYLGKFTK